MNTKTKYAELFVEQENAKKSVTKSQKNIHNFVTKRLNYLHTVGNSVAAKCYGTRALKPQDYGFNMEWLSSSFKVIRLETNYIVIEATGKNKNGYTSKYEKCEVKLQISYLSLSDRDFAKRVRNSIKGRKQHLRDEKVKNAQTEINKLQKEIDERQKQIDEFNRMMKK